MGDDLALANPVGAIRQVSHDPSLKRTILLRSRPAGHGDGDPVEPARAGPQVRALARPRLRRRGASAPTCSRRWEAVLTGLEHDRDSRRRRRRLGRQAAAGRRLRRAARRLRPGDARLKALDLQYHDMRPDKCLADRVGLQTLVDATTRCSAAMTEPPTTTRAYFRGRCLAKWPADIVAANWDSLVFDIGRDPLRRVPMMEPLRGTAEHVARLIDESDTAADLLARVLRSD